MNEEVKGFACRLVFTLREKIIEFEIVYDIYWIKCRGKNLFF